MSLTATVDGQDCTLADWTIEDNQLVRYWVRPDGRRGTEAARVVSGMPPLPPSRRMRRGHSGSEWRVQGSGCCLSGLEPYLVNALAAADQALNDEYGQDSV